MIDKTSILYIYQEPEKLIIKTKNGKEVFNKTFKEFINPYCIAQLTTLKGRIDAIKIKYRMRKHIPIFIDLELNLFPTSNQKDINNIYVNAYNIKRVLELEDNQTIIIFKNDDKLVIHKSYKIIYRNYQRALDISK
jgi:competence transcription factor ComK